jgi:hypothetical protein
MKAWNIALLAAVLIATAGCRTTSVAVGMCVDDIVKAHEGQKVEFFDAKGAAVPARVEGQSGSVSIHNKEGTAQDNYAFDGKGGVLKHRRSAGDNYAKGIWADVP